MTNGYFFNIWHKRKRNNDVDKFPRKFSNQIEHWYNMVLEIANRCNNRRSTGSTESRRTKTRKWRILPIYWHCGRREQWVQLTFTVSKERIPFCWKRKISYNARLWSTMQWWFINPGSICLVLLGDCCIVLEQNKQSTHLSVNTWYSLMIFNSNEIK